MITTSSEKLLRQVQDSYEGSNNNWGQVHAERGSHLGQQSLLAIVRLISTKGA